MLVLDVTIFNLFCAICQLAQHVMNLSIFMIIHNSLSKCKDKMLEIKEKLKSLENKGDKHVTFSVYTTLFIH